jgi:Domain of unknown function (DUF4383)
MATRAAGNRTPAQMFALVFGVVYLLVGIAGFFVTGFDGFASEHGEKLIIFHVNPLHNIVHILIGVVWIGAASSHDSAKSVNVLIGVAYLLTFVLGLFDAKFLAIDGPGDPDNYLHLVSGALSLYFGTAGATGSAGARTT